MLDRSASPPSRLRAAIALLAVALLVMSVWAAAGVPGWDEEPSRWARELDQGGFATLVDAFTLAGSPAVSWLVVGVAVVVALRWHRPVLAVAAALAAAEVTTTLLKALVGRPRPPGAVLEDLVSPGYPSGHVARIAALAVVVTWLWLRGGAGRPWVALLAALVIAMGAARVIGGAHYLTDVGGGLLLGLLVGAVVVLIERRQADR